jgi:hypothetical protein
VIAIVKKLCPLKFPSLAAIVLACVVWWGCPSLAQATPLGDRIAAFPAWQTKPPVQAAMGELNYPDWMAGTWKLTSTLVDLAAPLAPEITTPGYEGNRQFLNQPVVCTVRFLAETTLARSQAPIPLLSLPTRSLVKPKVISDRAFNGLSLAKAYLGERVFRVWVDRLDSSRLITKFRDNRKLFSTVTGQAVEQPDPDHFLASEMFQQFFQSPEKPYKNEVETTTAYTRLPDGGLTADQITAVYLSPPHPKAYLAGDRPVALYRYRLDFAPVK